MHHPPQKDGFTLVELLIVISIITILAGVVFVALDPLTRFKDTRDAVRASDVDEIFFAVKLDQVDRGGDFMNSINTLNNGEVYMIVDGASMVSGCNDQNIYCDTAITSDTHCVNLEELVTEGYLASIPVSPEGNVIWDHGEGATDEGTGYTLSKSSTGILTIRACESENTGEIIQSG